MKKKFILFLLFVTFIAVPLFACDDAEKIIKEESNEIDMEIAFAGDVMCHSGQYRAAYNPKTRTYNFDDNYSEIKKYVQKADYAICNLETTLGDYPYSGYPAFKSPKAVATAIKKGGFDMTVHANNHSIDRGTDAILNTVKICRKRGLDTSGCRLENEQRYTIKKIKGTKIAILNYTYELGVNPSRHNLNGIPMDEKAVKAINTFRYRNSDLDIKKEDLACIKKEIKKSKKAGAKAIILILHWGEEYMTEPYKSQQRLATELAKSGVDVIFASHPHVIQPIRIINTDKKSGIMHSVPVYYSMGNFVSDQRREFMGQAHSEQGAIAFAKIKIKDGNVIKVTPEVLPFWVDKFYNGSKTSFVAVPLVGNLKNSNALKTSGNYGKAKNAKVFAAKILNEKYFIKASK